MVNNPVTGEELVKQPLGTGIWGLQPGMLSNQYSEYNAYIITLGSDYGNNEMIKLVEMDLNAIGLKVERYEEGMAGGYCIAIAVKDEMDYHFYRENGDGTWSCKRGGKGVEIGIENPQVDAYENKYKTFLGYFYISSKEGEYGINEKDY